MDCSCNNIIPLLLLREKHVRMKYTLGGYMYGEDIRSKRDDLCHL